MVEPPADLPMTVVVLTDGKAGDEQQCLAVAEALGVRPILRRVRPRRLFEILSPWGPVDPVEAPGRPGSPIGPPWPDLAIASGRRAVPYLRALRQASAGHTYAVVLKDPRTGPAVADLVWAPSYDRIRGPNVLTTLTSPHRLTAARLSAARAHPDPRLAALPRPRAAILVGGPSRHSEFGPDETRRLLADLSHLAAAGSSLMVSTSRRTPEPLRIALGELAAATGGFAPTGGEADPHLALLGAADLVVVTADSVNMLSEAAATGVPVLVFDLPTRSRRHRSFLSSLAVAGVTRPFAGRPESYRYEPLDSTPVIAHAIAQGLARHRAARDLT